MYVYDICLLTLNIINAITLIKTTSHECMNVTSVHTADICLLTPTSIAMQQLLDIHKDYGAANDIAFKSLKSVTLFIRKYKLIYPRVLTGNVQLESICARRIYIVFQCILVGGYLDYHPEAVQAQCMLCPIKIIWMHCSGNQCRVLCKDSKMVPTQLL